MNATTKTLVKANCTAPDKPAPQNHSPPRAGERHEPRTWNKDHKIAPSLWRLAFFLRGKIWRRRFILGWAIGVDKGFTGNAFEPMDLVVKALVFFAQSSLLGRKAFDEVEQYNNGSACGFEVLNAIGVEVF